MDFDVKHTNGYFDESLETIINDIKTKNGFKANGVLDRQTYENILSSAIYLMSNDETKDLQLQKAKELMR